MVYDTGLNAETVSTWDFRLGGVHRSIDMSEKIVQTAGRESREVITCVRFLKNFGRNVKATGLYFFIGILLSALFNDMFRRNSSAGYLEIMRASEC